MPGVFDGLEVLDLSHGVAGPMTTMLLADNGALVTRIEPPGGDPSRRLSGHRVWNRGKRSAVLNLRDDVDRQRLCALATTADVLIESFAPRTTERLGVDYDTMREINPRLIYCSITGYGDVRRHEGHPGIDALVAARTGQLWAGRGIAGTTICDLSGAEAALPGVEAPDGLGLGPDRQGPLFSGVPWPSVAAFYIATLGVSAALRAREQTGLGQRVTTSLLQGVLATTSISWQQVERPHSPGYLSWVLDQRAPKGFFKASDGRWIHQWVPLPPFVLNAGNGNELAVREGVTSPRDAELRLGMDVADMVLLHHFHPLMATAVSRFPSAAWQRLAAEVGVPLQPVFSPEEALRDPLFLADGCVIETEDPDVGRIRHVGKVYSLDACPAAPTGHTPRPGEHTVDVVRRADARRTVLASELTGCRPTATQLAAAGRPALDGIRVLDLGIAIAGPYGAQLLADLGADVIKVNAFGDASWMGTHFGMMCNRGKRSIAVDLKTPGGSELLRKLVSEADIVTTNWRRGAAARRGISYEAFKHIKSDIIFCHSHGFENGPRADWPCGDPTGAALAGTEWVDGGLDNGGHPLWPLISLGDTGVGFLAAIALVQALYHRDRTGEGQLVETSLIYAHLLNASSAWVSSDTDRVADRPMLDAELLGVSARYRLYETADGWLCLAAQTQAQWRALSDALDRPDLRDNPEFDSSDARRRMDRDLTEILASEFLRRPTDEWTQRLAKAEVPCESAPYTRIAELFEDQELLDKGWLTSFEHPTVGRTTVAGRLLDFSLTPSAVPKVPPLVGQHTNDILRELGYTAAEIDRLEAEGVVRGAGAGAGGEGSARR